MKKFKPKNYTISDFLNWYDNKQLTLNPNFQRRAVWPQKAKEYLIDTILSDLPIPKIFIRENIDHDLHKTMRDVIDGQQRIKTIIEFYKGELKVNKVVDGAFTGCFKDLTPEMRDEFLEYDLSVDIVQNMEFKNIIDVFARLNTYSYSLNNQEILNSQYFGEFKTLVYKLSAKYYNFWVDRNVFNIQRINRMADAELVSDILAVMVIKEIGSRADTKKIYKDYDDEIKDKEKIRKAFISILNFIEENFGEYLQTSNFRRPQFLYGLVVSLYHLTYSEIKSLPTTTKIKSKIKFDNKLINSLKTTIEEVDLMVNENSFSSEKEKAFFASIRYQTTNKAPRLNVCKYLTSELIKNY